MTTCETFETGNSVMPIACRTHNCYMHGDVCPRAEEEAERHEKLAARYSAKNANGVATDVAAANLHAGIARRLRVVR